MQSNWVKKISYYIIACMVLTLTCIPVLAQSYELKSSTISSGGGVSTSASYKLVGTVGQPSAGFSSNANLLHWIGFWAGEVPTPKVVTNIADVKLLADGILISTTGKIVTSGVGDFSNFFYIEDPARISGIRVAAPPSAVVNIARGSVVNVIGTLGTTAFGERQLVGPLVIISSSTAPLAPLGMNNRSIGGGDLGNAHSGQIGVTGGSGVNNVGLLVSTWGRVVEVDSGYVLVDDGGGPVRVDTTTLASQPLKGSYINVIGISSLYVDTYTADYLRLILPRNNKDIQKLN